METIESSGWYNGYNWKEREAKLRALKRRMASGEQPAAVGPCDLCGDPEVPVEYHDEDYSLPYLWESPALFKLCRNCHRNKLHKRFADPAMWKAYLMHVRRGGYARDLKDRAIKKEFDAARVAIAQGDSIELPSLRPYTRQIGEEWFANITMDPASLTSPAGRPRP